MTHHSRNFQQSSIHRRIRFSTWRRSLVAPWQVKVLLYLSLPPFSKLYFSLVRKDGIPCVDSCVNLFVFIFCVVNSSMCMHTRTYIRNGSLSSDGCDHEIVRKGKQDVTTRNTNRASAASELNRSVELPPRQVFEHPPTLHLRGFYRLRYPNILIEGLWWIIISSNFLRSSDQVTCNIY